jgi:hypothetical protein
MSWHNRGRYIYKIMLLLKMCREKKDEAKRKKRRTAAGRWMTVIGIGGTAVRGGGITDYCA